MSETLRPRQSRGRLIGGIMFGVLIGLFSPYLLLLAPLVFLAPVLTARLYAHGGIWPVAASAAAQLIVSFALFGPVGGAMVLLSAILPLFATIDGIAREKPIAEQLRASLPAWILCALAAFLLGHFAAGMSLADYVATAFESWLKSSPNGVNDLVLSALSGTGFPQDFDLLMLRADFLQNGFLGAAERARALQSVLSAVRNSTALYLPGLLISSAALTAILSTAWPNRVLSREAKLPTACWEPVAKWHVPMSMSFALLALYLGSMIAARGAGVVEAEAVYAAATMIAGLAFRVQAAGSLERRFLAMGMRPGARGAAIGFFVLFPYFSDISFYYGMLSALVGPSYGAIPELLKRRRGDGDDGEDS